MDFNPTINVFTANNSYEVLLYKKYFNAVLGAGIIVGGTITQSIFTIPDSYSLTIAMCGGALIGKSIGINTALSKVTSTIESRINMHYNITMQEAKSLIDDVVWGKIVSGALFVTGTALTLSETLDPSSKLLLFGGTLGSYFYGKSLGINDSLKLMGLPQL